MKLGEILSLPPGALIKGVTSRIDQSTDKDAPPLFYLRIDDWSANIKDNVIPSTVYEDKYILSLNFIKATNLYDSLADLRSNGAKHFSLLKSLTFFNKKLLHDIHKGKIVGMSLGESILLLNDWSNTLSTYRRGLLDLYCLHRILFNTSVKWLLLKGQANINFYNTILESRTYNTSMEII